MSSQSVGSDNCDECSDASHPSDLIAQGDGDMLCSECDEARRISHAEQAADDEFTAYHEGTAPDYVYEAMAARGRQ